MKRGRAGDGVSLGRTIRRSELSGAPKRKRRRGKRAQAMTREQYYARDGLTPPD